MTTLEEAGKTAVVVVRDSEVLGVVAVRDEPRPDAAAGIAALGRLGVECVMLTGDNRRTGEAIAKGLGLFVRSDLLPGTSWPRSAC